MSRLLVFLTLVLLILEVKSQSPKTEIVKDKFNEKRQGHLMTIGDCFSLFVANGTVVYSDAKLNLKDFKAIAGNCPTPSASKSVNKDAKSVTDGDTRYEMASLTFTANLEHKDLTQIEVTIKTIHDLHMQYWSVKEVSVKNKKGSIVNLDAESNHMTAPTAHSFSCTNLELYRSLVQESKKNTATDSKSSSDKQAFINSFAKLVLSDFQIQPFKETIFAESYDCASWFSIGTFIGSIVLIFFTLILAFGICYIMSIKSMDRFEDPKSKPLQLGNTDM